MVDAVLDGEPIALAGRPGRGCPSNEEARAAATARPSNVTGGGGRPLRPGGASLGARDGSAKAALDCCPSYRAVIATPRRLRVRGVLLSCVFDEASEPSEKPVFPRGF